MRNEPGWKKIVVLVEGCSCVKTNKPVRHFRNACAHREKNEICMALNKGMIMILISLHCVPSFKFHEFYILSRCARACISEITTNLAALSDRPRVRACGRLPYPDPQKPGRAVDRSSLEETRKTRA